MLKTGVMENSLRVLFVGGRVGVGGGVEKKGDTFTLNYATSPEKLQLLI